MHAKQLTLLSTLAGLSLALGACGSDSLTLPSEGEAAQIEVFGETGNQQGRVGTELSEPLAVQVTDSKDRPVIGVAVQFAIDDGSGSSPAPTSVTTGDSGIARTTITLGPRVGPVTGRAWIPVNEGQTPVETAFTAMALPADANGIVMVEGDEQSGAVGTVLLPLVVRVTDGFGNPIPGVTVNWSAEGGGSVSAASTLTDVNGLTSVERTLGPAAGPQSTIAAAGTPTAPLAGSPVIFNHTATAGNAARVIVVDGNGQQGPPGAALPEALVVQVLDDQNNPIVNRPVTWVIGAGEGSVSPSTSNTDGQGRASTTWTLGPEPGRNTVSAVVSGVGVGAFTATAIVTKTSSSTAIVSHAPEPSTVGQPVEVQVQVSSSAGTPTGTVQVTGENAAAPCTVTLANGTGACSLTFNTAGQQRITATYGGDAQFNGSSDEENHRVEGANTAPTAAFNPPTGCIAGQPCQFNDASTDSDGNVVGWLWEFGDGGTSDQKDPSHIYATPGNYNVKLTVRDDDGATGEVTHAVSVGAANFPPVANDDNYTTPAGTSFHAPDGTRPSLLANDADLEGGPLTTSAASGPTVAGGTFQVFTDGSFDYTPASGFIGQDSFDYTVNDGSGGSDTGTTFIDVGP